MKVLRLGAVFFSVIYFLGSSVFAAGEQQVSSFLSSIKINSLIQYWYQYDQSLSPKSTFKFKRTEFKLSGDADPHVTWVIIMDPAQIKEDDVTSTPASGLVTYVGRKSPLQDCYITLKHRSITIDMGQYKVPFGYEGIESSAKIDFAERSTISSQLKWSDLRDIGVQIKMPFSISNIGLNAVLGVFNGDGQNKQDTNETKDVSGRILVKLNKAIQIGYSQYAGKATSLEIENNHTGFDLKYANGPMVAYGEYAYGKSSGKEKLAYYLTGTYFLFSSLQLAVKYDYCDPDTSVSSNANVEATSGVNLFILNNTKLQLNYVLRAEEGTAIDNDILRVNFQVAF